MVHLKSVLPTLPYVKWIANGNLLYDSRVFKQGLCNRLEEWDGREMGERFKREVTYVYL